MYKRIFPLIPLFLIPAGPSVLACKAIIDIRESPYAVMRNVGLDEVSITGGFWKARQDANRKASIELLWDGATGEEIGHSLRNFKIAAGLKEGEHIGVTWQDEWLYKWIEAASYIYAATGEEELLERIDSVVPIIAKAQESDGYIATQVTSGRLAERWLRPDNHELYNMGHLLKAGAVHYRITGQTDLLGVANRAAAFCLKQFKEHPDVMWEFPLNPSMIMGAVELYRATRNPDALELAKHIVDLRGSTYPENPVPANWGRPEWGPIDRYQGGRDLYQNFMPLRRETEVLGHAVFFTYLYAGATDIYLETGDSTLMEALNRLWTDLTEKKMYVTGGVSPTTRAAVTRSYVEGQRQVNRWEPIHEGITRPYDLPNAIGYNETCGMVGNMMWNWRMLQATGDPKYAEIMELTWYNSILPGVQLDGSLWSYTNPLRWHGAEHEREMHQYDTRHFPGRQHICCPTNVTRNLSAYQGYLYSVSDDILWVHHYAESEVSLKEMGLAFRQETDYPWNGRIRFVIDEAPDREVAIKLRVPAWVKTASLTVNGEAAQRPPVAGQYVRVKQNWSAGDEIVLNLDMPVRLLAGNHRFEHIRNQVAVKRGPVVYCLESHDVKGAVDFSSIAIAASGAYIPEFRENLLGGVMVIKTTATAYSPPKKNLVGHYYDISGETPVPVNIELIPYFAWNNREVPEMSVWLPLIR